MMAAARAVGGKAVAERELRGEPGAAGRVPSPGRQPLGHLEADPTHFLLRDAKFEDFGDIVAVVNRLDPFARHRLGLVKRHFAAILLQRDEQQPIFVPRKLPAHRPGRHVERVMDEVEHGH